MAQYQPWELLKPHALQGEPYRSFMYSMPQVICVAGLVRQSSPTLAILLPGRDCGMPYAPEEALVALMSQLLSRMMMLLKHWYWSLP